MLAVAVVVASVLASGCSSDQAFTVGSQHLVVKDQIYQSKATYFCNGLAADQVKFRFVDYGPACAVDRNGAPDPFDATKEHTELDIVISFTGNPMWPTKAFDASGDCDAGGANAAVTFLHVPANANGVADTTMKATVGSIKLGTYDPTGAKPTTGNFDVTIGGSQVKGSINSYSCN